MPNTNEGRTKMYKEAAEAHARVRAQLIHNESSLRHLGERLRRKPAPYIMVCARGSSSHAGIYARYLIETRFGIPVLPVAPSLSSVFAVKQELNSVLFLAISQSGQSPDILSAAKAAKDGGAFVVSFVNNEQSPLASLSDIVIPIHAGEETSIAATKTFICTLSAIAQMVAEWGGIETLKADLQGLPDKLEQAFQLSWDNALEPLSTTQSLFVVSRGLGLSIAKEAALKFKETCCIHAQAFSAAEVKQGPMALVKNGFPVLIFSTGDKTQVSIDAVTTSFVSQSAQIFTTGHSHSGVVRLSTTENASPELMPIITIQSFYRFINALSLRRGLDPDNPEYLNKITETV